MATRSQIGIVNKDGTIRCVYCHWDGYPSNNGKILQEHYTNAQKINTMLDLGDISSLHPLVLIPEGVEHTYEKSAENVTVFYGRDRGEDGTEATISANKEVFTQRMSESWCEFGYLYENGEWQCFCTYDNKWYSIPDAITKEEKGW